MTDYDPEAILADPDAPWQHKVYALINIDVRDNGTRWSKCANCGDPYPMGDGYANETVCSRTCEHEYIRYLKDGSHEHWR